MIRFRDLPFILLAALFFTHGTALAAEPFEGDWAGGFQESAVWSTFLIHLKMADNRPSGTIDMIQGFVTNHPLDALAADADHIQFKFNDQDRHLSFDGKLKGDTVIGSVRHDGLESAFRLDRVIKTDPNRFARMYQMASDNYTIVYPVRMTLGEVRFLLCLNSQTGLLQPLFPRSEEAFFSGPSFAAEPAENAAEFTTDAQRQMTLKWTTRTGDVHTGHSLSIHEEKLSFNNGNVTLAGSLLLPPTPGPYPAVIFIHGSGPSSRNDYRLWADYFIANGVAALIFDKRGVGESTGNWAAAGFDELAGDALAAVEKLKDRPDIRPDKIGFCGMSQAGWIMPLAASRSADVAFVIALSGAGVSPEEQGAYMVEHRVRSEKFGDAEVAQALALYRLNSHCARTNAGWDELDAAVTRAQKEPWFHPEFAPQDRGTVGQWQSICDHDPVAVLHKVHCPVLAILGKLDALVPAEKSAAVWKTALAEADNRDATIQILPYADHGLADPLLGIQHPEFFTLQRDWLIQHINGVHSNSPQKTQ